MAETRQFHLGVILSVTTGIFACQDIEDMYKLLKYMTGESPMTHQLGRFADECIPYLLEAHPFLNNITKEMIRGSEWESKLAELVKRYGEFHAVRPIHHEDHVQRDPLDELHEIAPHVRIIGIDTTSLTE